MTSVSTYISLFLLLNYVGMMLGFNKANRAKDEGMSMLNQLHKSCDEEMYCRMELFIYGEDHFILCISCMDDDFGQLMIVTWNFLEKEGHLTTVACHSMHFWETTLEPNMHNTLQKMEEAFLMWMPFGGEWMALHLLLQFLKDKQHFSREDCNIPNFS